jgi:hypothetical protein
MTDRISDTTRSIPAKFRQKREITVNSGSIAHSLEYEVSLVVSSHKGFKGWDLACLDVFMGKMEKRAALV